MNLGIKEGEGERVRNLDDLEKMTMKEKEWLIDRDLVFSSSHRINDQDTLHPALQQQQQQQVDKEAKEKEKEKGNKHMDELVWKSNGSTIQSNHCQGIMKTDRNVDREEEMQMQIEEEQDLSTHSPLLSPSSTTPQHSPLLDRLSASFNDFSSSDQTSQASQTSLPPLELPPPPIPPTTELELELELEKPLLSVPTANLMGDLDEKREEMMKVSSIEQEIKHIDIIDITNDEDESDNDNDNHPRSGSTLLSKTINVVKQWLSSVTSWL